MLFSHVIIGHLKESMKKCITLRTVKCISIHPCNLCVCHEKRTTILDDSFFYNIDLVSLRKRKRLIKMAKMRKVERMVRMPNSQQLERARPQLVALIESVIQSHRVETSHMMIVPTVT